MKRRKIALVSPDAAAGGIWQYTHQLAAALQRKADVAVFVADPFAHEASLMAGRLEQPLDFLPNVSKMLATARCAWDKVTAFEPDIVEVTDWPWNFVPAVLEQSMPYVVQCHGSLGQISTHDPQPGDKFESAMIRLIEPQLLRAAHRLQSQSLQNKEFWEVKTGRTVELIRPAYAVPARCGDDDPISTRAAVFGRLQRWKGPHVLCDALRLLGRRAPEVDWYGTIKPWSESALSSDEYLSIHFRDVWGYKFYHHAAVERPMVSQLQSRALFNIVPSTWDVFNFTAVESMAGGRPSIVSTGAGASELIVDGANGFTFLNEDSDSLAAAIDRVMSLSDHERFEVGRAGRQTIQLELDPSLIADKRLAAYEEAILAFQQTTAPQPDAWLGEIFDPKFDRLPQSKDLLRTLPMRAIALHSGRRLIRKMFKIT